MIDPGIWQSQDFGNLTTLAKLVFIGLFSQADDEGRGRANTQYIKNTLFPYDEKMQKSDIEKSFSEIADYMSIRFYEIGGSEYYALTNWSVWQKVERPTPSRMPEPGEGAQIVRGDIPDKSGKGNTPSGDERKKHGEYGWVRLSEREYKRLVSDYGEKIVRHYIAVVDEKAQQTGNKNKWKDWSLTVRNAIKQKWGNPATGVGARPGRETSSAKDYDEEF
jgi:hypothetical protein